MPRALDRGAHAQGERALLRPPDAALQRRPVATARRRRRCSSARSNDKLVRTVDRIYRLLGLIYPWKDIAAARHAVERGDRRTRARALEYLDNLLKGAIRRACCRSSRILPIDEKAHAKTSSHPAARSKSTLAQLVHDGTPWRSSRSRFVGRRLVVARDDLSSCWRRRNGEHAFGPATWAWPPQAGAAETADALPVVELADRSARDSALRLRLGRRIVPNRGERARRCGHEAGSRPVSRGTRSPTTCSSCLEGWVAGLRRDGAVRTRSRRRRRWLSRRSSRAARSPYTIVAVDRAVSLALGRGRIPDDAVGQHRAGAGIVPHAARQRPAHGGGGTS